MGRSLRSRDLEKAYIDLATQLFDDQPGKRWRERLRDEARDDWKSIDDAGDRKAYVKDIKLLADLADASGGRAIDAAGEDVAQNYLLANNSAQTQKTSAFFRLMDRENPVLAWNAEAGVGLTQDDVESLLALMDARPNDKRFDVDRYADRHGSDVNSVAKEFAKAFDDLDADMAWLLGSFDVYAEGLEANWGDMSRRERRDALDFVQEGDAPKRATMKEFLNADDLVDATQRALKSVGLADKGHRDDGQLDRSDYTHRWVQLSEAVMDEKMTRSERRDLVDSARDAWDEKDEQGRLESYERLTQRKQVADADGGAAVEAAGENAVRNALLSFMDPEDWSSSATLRIFENHDPVVAWHEGAEVALTEADVEAIAALWDAKPKDKRFDADDFDRDSFRFYERELGDIFPEVSESSALSLAHLDAYAAGLEESWDDLTQKERRQALDMPWADGDLSPKLMRKIIGVESLAAARDAALATENLNPDLTERSADGGSDASSLDVSAALFDAQMQQFNQSLVYQNYMTGMNFIF